MLCPPYSIPDHDGGKLAQAASDNAQRGQYTGHEIQHIVKWLENLIVEGFQFGPLDEKDRAKLKTYALQFQGQVFASHPMPNKSVCCATRPSSRATNTAKPPDPLFSAMNLDVYPKETNVPSWAMDQRLKEGVDTGALQKAEMYDTPSLLPQEKHQSELARDRDGNLHHANSKSMPQVGAKSAQSCNPFRDGSISCSRSSQPPFLPVQNLQVGNAAEVNQPNPAPIMPNLPPVYSMPIHEGATPPSGFMSSTQSMNPFLASPILDYRSPRQTGTIQSLSQDSAGPQSDFELDWDQILSEDV